MAQLVDLQLVFLDACTVECNASVLVGAAEAGRFRELSASHSEQYRQVPVHVTTYAHTNTVTSRFPLPSAHRKAEKTLHKTHRLAL